MRAPFRLAINVMTLTIKVNTFMGRPPGRVQSQQFQMRVSDEFLKSVDKWRAKQDGKPSRAEAIRRLVELGLTVKAKSKQPSAALAGRAKELATKAAEKMIDPSVPAEERAQRRRRLTRGPSEFREDRADLPKAKK